jgi:cytochrome c oxidase cbb3-type subunit 1
MPIWPTWWWPQALMQPEMLMKHSPMSSCRSRLAKRSEIICATGMLRAVASAQ